MLLAGGLIFLRYQQLFHHLDEPAVIDRERDGLKTYMNAIWHARFDANTSEFAGMNYPYKEHIVAATELPGLAILLHWLNPYFPTLPDYVYGITHILLLVCIWLCPIFLYLIFRELSLPNWYAILVAIGLTFLAPQNLRFGAHFGLAPLCVVPAILYGLLLLEKRPRFAVSLYLSCSVLLASLLHFYFFAICTMSIGLYFLFSFCRNLNFQWLRLMLPHYAFILLVPTAFFFKWMILNDPVTDRSPKPWGFLVYRSKFEGIFTFQEMPFWKWINDHVAKLEKVEFEGWAYIGLVAGLFLLVSLVVWATVGFKKPFLCGIAKEHRQYLYPMLGRGVLLAIFSCSQPFATKGLEFLLDYTGPLRQFRSTGRFAWVFYFVVNILAFTGIYKNITLWRHNVLKYTFLALVLGILYHEAYTFTQSKYMFKNLGEVPELLSGSRFTDLPNIEYKRYQAILPIPYFNVGSNNFGANATGNILQLSCVMSAQTGLPLTGAMLTRSSRQQSFKQLQLVGFPYQHPNVLNHYPNQKPLLLLVSSEISKEDSLRYAHLFSDLIPLHKTDKWSLYELDLATFDNRIAQRKASILSAAQNKKLYRDARFQSTDSLTNYIYKDFDHLASKKMYNGTGTYEGAADAQNLVFEGNIPEVKAGQMYDLLLWVYVNEDRFTATTIKLREADNEGQELQELSWMVGKMIAEYDSSGWVLVQCPFMLKSSESTIRCSIQLADEKSKRLYVDDMLLKPQQTDLYMINRDTVWWNNRRFN